MTSVVNINEVLDGHVSLEIDCVDRLLLNAYAPNLQVGGQVVAFLTEHLGFPITAPALLQKIGNRFGSEVKAFAFEHGVPILALKKPNGTCWDDRKLDLVRPYLDKVEADGRTGVVAIVQTQEFEWVFSAKNRSNTPGVVSFDFVKEDAMPHALWSCRCWSRSQHGEWGSRRKGDTSSAVEETPVAYS